MDDTQRTESSAVILRETPLDRVAAVPDAAIEATPAEPSPPRLTPHA